MIKKIIFVILSFISLHTFAQYQASNWYFGENAGLSFNLNNNTVNTINNGQLNTREGCSSISDDSGNLLFYTDGVTIWNKNHVQMLNGFGLNGDASSTQSAIIIPKPKTPYIYYVFTVDDRGNQFNDVNYGLNFTEVDMQLDNGLGGVISKNMNLLQFSTEKISAVLKDCISESIWVVAFASEDGSGKIYNTFHAFEVTNFGVTPTAVKSKAGVDIVETRGYLKLSPDGTKLASANVKEGLFIYDFDTATGTLSNKQRLNINSTNGSIHPYGIEFSPNSKLLYVHSSNDFFGKESNKPENHYSTLTQFNLLDTNIENTQKTIDTRQLYRGGLQLGPDGKIYRALSATYNQGLPNLAVIEYPDIIGPGCAYNHNAISVSPNNSSQGLPPFIASFFNTVIDIIKNGKSNKNISLCEGEKYLLKADDIPGATYKWSKNNTVLPETDFSLEVSEAGVYEVYINPNNGDCAIEGRAFVNFNKTPQAINHTLLQCDEDGLPDGFTIFNLNEANNALTGGVPNRTVKFYTDTARTTEVKGDNFSNTKNPQTIYTEIIDNNTSCFSYCELTLQVSVTSAKDIDLPIICDDDGTEDGYNTFNLSLADNLILNGLPSGLSISYYQTYNDALLEQNNLGVSFTNTTPYTQTIYARVENANNCYGISKVRLTVSKLPDIITQETVFYCLNTFPNTISINANILNDSPNNYTYKWSNGETTYATEINQPGVYNVIITNTNGCSKNRSITVKASNTATFKNIKVIDASQNNSIEVITSGEGDYEYQLVDNNNVVITPYQTTNFFKNISPGIYTVHVKDIKNNCGVVQDKVSVIGFPKFFTPNNDGINDTWQVYGISKNFQPNTLIYIFNRFGKLLKKLTPGGEGWDGTFKGNKLPTDDYWFSVKLEDGRIFKNHFTLKH